MRIQWLPDVLRAEGLTVHLYDGWPARGSDAWGPLKGVICHATASNKLSTTAGDCRVLWVSGSNTAPAPISQLYLGRDGAWTVGATGKCNHVKTAITGPFKGYGNSSLIGIEAANNNSDEAWSAPMLESYYRGVAAICRHMGWTQAQVAGHKEHQPDQKTDPTFDMNWFRSQVGLVLAGQAGGTDMTVTLVEDVDNRGHYYMHDGINFTPVDVDAMANGIGDLGWMLAGKWRLDGSNSTYEPAAFNVRQHVSNRVIAEGPHVDIPLWPISRYAYLPTTPPDGGGLVDHTHNTAGATGPAKPIG
jgi:hypothetical protein